MVVVITWMFPCDIIPMEESVTQIIIVNESHYQL